MKCSSLGHVCGLWKLRPRCRGPSVGLCPVRPVLPSILRRHQGTFMFELCVVWWVGIKNRAADKPLTAALTDQQGGAE